MSEDKKPVAEESARRGNPQAELYGALAKAQGAMKNPERNRTVVVRSEKGSYTFDYATLDNIIDTARAALADNGIAVVQCVETNPLGQTVLITRLLHKSGGSLINEMPIELPKPKKRVGRDGSEYFEEPRIQEMGSIITYARRYAICAILNIAAEEDDDGTSGQDRDVKPRAPLPAGATEKGPSARASFVRIRDAMKAAKDAIGLAQVIMESREDLLAIKKASETGYAELMKIKDDREAEFKAGGDK